MPAYRNKLFLFPLIFAIAAGEFYLDLISPLNVSDWIWYFIPLFLSIYVGQKYFPYLLVSLFSFLILIGFYWAPPGINRDIAMIGRVAGICALWLMAVLITRRKELTANLHKTERALKTIIKCDEVLVRATSESALVQEICQLIVENGVYRLAWIGLRNEDAAKSVRIAAYAGCDEGYLDSLKITWADSERGRGPVGTTLRTGQKTLIQNFLTDPNTAPWHRKAAERNFASAISLPLFVDKKIIGALNIYAGTPNAFSDEEVKLLSELAGDLSYGIQSQRVRLEHQQTEAALERERNLLRTLIDNLPDFIFVRDADNRFVLANKAIAKQLGADSPTELLGKTDADFFDAEQARRFTADDRTVLAGKTLISFEQDTVYPDGKRRVMLVTKLPLLNAQGVATGLIGIGHDITERKAAEEKIREQAEMLNLAHDAITIRDLDNHILYWNKGAERIYGWTSEEAVGKTSRDLFKIDSLKFSEAYQKLLADGHWTGEFTNNTKSGREVVVEAFWTLLFDPGGQPKSILAFSVDITEQRRLEQQAIRNQRLESLGTLSSGIAHDLNNILTPIMVSVGILKTHVQDPALNRLIASLESSTQRGAQLVKQILTFGRGVKGERVLIRLRDIIREVQQIILETFPKSIQVETQVADNLWCLTGDPTQIHQVLLNLAINSRDAMPNGGKIIFILQNTIIDAANTALNSDVRPGNYVLIQVTDNGTGIAKKNIEQIFDPFFSTKPHGQGTGLGLSVSLGIVKSHGGFINVYSEPGRGSTFKVYLPAQTVGEANEPERPVGSTLLRGNNQLILLVDDEESICTTAKKILEHHGYRVITAANGAEAVSLYAAQPAEIAVVITDMHMPIMDGPAAIIALQSMNPAVKIIGSSGLAAYGSTGKAASSGVRHFLPKPYSTEQLLRSLREVMDSES